MSRPARQLCPARRPATNSRARCPREKSGLPAGRCCERRCSPTSPGSSRPARLPQVRPARTARHCIAGNLAQAPCAPSSPEMSVPLRWQIAAQRSSLTQAPPPDSSRSAAWFALDRDSCELLGDACAGGARDHRTSRWHTQGGGVDRDQARHHLAGHANHRADAVGARGLDMLGARRPCESVQFLGAMETVNLPRRLPHPVQQSFHSRSSTLV